MTGDGDEGQGGVQGTGAAADAAEGSSLGDG
jgi:hypothetical protein